MVAHVGPLGSARTSGAKVLIPDISLFVVMPLVASLHARVVVNMRSGRTFHLGSPGLAGVWVLVNVVATAIITTIGVALGFILLIAPGFLVAIRWFVAVQVTAVEQASWTRAIKRSWQLTHGCYSQVFAFAVLVWCTTEIPLKLAGVAVNGHDTLLVPFCAGVGLQALSMSFASLATALLYFELVDRESVTHAH